MSASSCCVTCGIVTQLRREVGARELVDPRQRVDLDSPNLAKSICGHGSRSSAAVAGARRRGAASASALFTNARTSSAVMRPLRPGAR